MLKDLLFCLAAFASIITLQVAAKPFVAKVSHSEKRWAEAGLGRCQVLQAKRSIYCEVENAPAVLPFDVESIIFDWWDYDEIQGNLGQLVNLKNFEIRGCALKKLPPLNGLPKLQSVVYDGIDTEGHVINEGAFANLNNLDWISVKNSPMIKIEKNAFVNISSSEGASVAMLDLSFNQFTTLTSEGFNNVKVEILDIGGNSFDHIRHIDKDFFKGFSHLNTMILHQEERHLPPVISFDPKPKGFSRFQIDKEYSWNFLLDGFCGNVAKSGCKCVVDLNIIDCTMKPPGLSPLKWWTKRSQDTQPSQIKYVRYDVTQLFKQRGKGADAQASKSASILKWCQHSFPDDIQLIHFEKSLGRSVQVDRMTVDIKEMEQFFNPSGSSLKINSFLLTSSKEVVTLPRSRSIELGAAKITLKGKIYDEVPLMMVNEDVEIKCVKGAADGICRTSLRSLTIESECRTTCPSISPPTSVFTPTFLQSLLFCGKRSNAERKDEVLEKTLMRFVEKVANGDGIRRTDLAAAAGSMAGSIGHRDSSSLHPVPYLSGKVWQRITESIKNRLDAAVKTQVELKTALVHGQARLFNRQESVRQREEDLKRLLRKSANALQNSKDVVEVRKSDFEDAQNEVDKSMAAQKKLHDRFKKARKKMEGAMKDFKRGCEKYQAEKIAEAALSIASSIFGIFVGKVEFDATTKAVEKISKVLSIVRELKEIIETLKEVGITIKTVLEFMNTAKDIPKEIPNAGVYEAYESKMQLVEKVSDLSVSVIEWKNLRNFADAVFGAGEIVQIDGASSLRRAIADLGNWGEAVTNEAIAQAKVVKEMNAMRRKRQLAEKQNTRMGKELKEIKKNMKITASDSDDYAKKLDATIATTLKFVYKIRLEEMHLQLLLFDALNQYCNTYFYSKFEECPASYKPTLSLTPDELMGHINLIYETGWKALAKFNPAPLHLDALDVVVEDDPQICNGDKWNYQQCPIRSLKDTGALKVAFHPMDKSFRNYNRFRVTKIQVYLEGAKTSGKNEHVYVKIATSGIFNDTFNGNDFNFVSVPLNLAFEYVPDTKHVTIDGSINDEDRQNYYQTTPFTDWIISLPKEANPQLHVETLKSVNLVFSGSVVPKFYRLAGRHH